MSIPKAAGIETEYGVMILEAEESNVFLASRLLINSYRQIGGPTAPTFEEHALRRRNKGSAHHDTSFMLANGARFYIDHAHPEYSTPECISPRLLVAADKAGERILAASQLWVNTNNILPEGQRILVYKNNTDYKSNSYGCHENYLLKADLFTDLMYRRVHRVFRSLLPFLITRIVLCGAGKVGSENDTEPVGFQLSQRADFFESLMNIETTRRRPLFNTRDEPHADSKRFRRLHVILGDANMAEFSTYLKIGTTQLVLHMLEDNFIRADLTLEKPLEAIRTVSRDLTFKQTLEMEDGRQMTALEIQQIYLSYAEKYLEEKGGSDEQWDVWHEWEDVLSSLQNQSEPLATRLDWAIKKHLLDRYLGNQEVAWSEVAAWQPIIEEADDLTIARELARKKKLSWEDYEKQKQIYFALRRLDLEYHDIRYDSSKGETGLFYQLQQQEAIERFLTDEEINHMVTQPSPDTRAWLRGHFIARFENNIASVDWGLLHFYLPDLADAQSRSECIFDLLDPLRWTEAEMASIWDQLDSSLKVLERLMQ